MRSMSLAGFAIAALATMGLAMPSNANVLPESTWTSFTFGGVGSTATPDFTFVTSSPGDVLTVTDAYYKGDVFNIFDFGTQIGSTSFASASTNNTTSNPDLALIDSTYSHGTFSLGVGAHDITIKTNQSPFGSGGAFLRRDPALVSSITATPEPGSVAMLVGMGVSGAGFLARRRKLARKSA